MRLDKPTLFRIPYIVFAPPNATHCTVHNAAHPGRMPPSPFFCWSNWTSPLPQIAPGICRRISDLELSYWVYHK